MKKQISVLGCTGSIGEQALNVIATRPDEMALFGIAANRNVGVMLAQANKYLPRVVACETEFDASQLPDGVTAIMGEGAASQLAAMQEKLANLEERTDAQSEVNTQQAKANELKRCDNLPPFYKTDCVARVNGQGQSSGSVIGGGVISETVTTLPKAELQAMERNPREMDFPKPLRQR